MENAFKNRKTNDSTISNCMLFLFFDILQRKAKENVLRGMKIFSCGQIFTTYILSKCCILQQLEMKMVTIRIDILTKNIRVYFLFHFWIQPTFRICYFPIFRYLNEIAIEIVTHCKEKIEVHCDLLANVP